jgi:hypothetical protein
MAGHHRSASRPLLPGPALLALLLAGCARLAHPTPVALVSVEEPSASAGWRAVATAADADRLARLDQAWAEGLAQARPLFARAIDKEGALLDPRGALPRATPPPGTYLCRTVTLGRRVGAAPGARRVPAFEAFRPFTCFVAVESDQLVLMKATGSRLPGGRLWDEGADMATAASATPGATQGAGLADIAAAPGRDQRLVFLGATADRPGAAAPAYGAAADRDRAGILERVGEFRWRLTLPWVAGGPPIELLELTPDPAAVPIPGG